MDAQFKSTEQLIAFIGNAIFSTLLPTNFSGEEGLSQLFCFTISGYCKDVNLVLDTLLHQAVAVRISYQQQYRLFHGVVAEVVDQGLKGYTFRRFSITLRPQIWFLGLTKTSRIFTQLTVPEIFREIIQAQKIFTIDLQGLTQSYLPKSYCVQYNESNLVFMLRLMEEVGIQFYFSFDEKQHTLHLLDNLNLLPQLTATVCFNNLQPDGRYIYDWQQQFCLTANQACMNDYNYESPNLNLTTQLKSINEPSGSISVLEKYQYPGNYQDLSVGQKQVSLALQREMGQQELISGMSNVLAFSGGNQFQFDAKEDASQSGQYFLIKVLHDCQNDPQLTVPGIAQSMMTTSYYNNQFTACSSLLRYCPPQCYKKPVIYGYHNAIVIASDSIDPLGRIKVNFPWDDYNTSSDWIRVTQTQVGSGWGTHFLPGVGAEVLIQYIDGDIDKPIFIGAHYNAAQKSIYPLPENRHLSGFKTTSASSADFDKGHEIQFNDLPQQEMLHLKAEHELNESIKHDACITIGHAETITIGGNHVTQANGSIVFQCATSIRFVAAGGSIEVTPQSIHIKGSQIAFGV